MYENSAATFASLPQSQNGWSCTARTRIGGTMSDAVSKTAAKVWLVGAGPGDPDLLTLRAARLVMQARLIVHDGLVDPAILALARPAARLISVAKQRSRHTMPQDEINALLVREALAGTEVVRLKGGDPFIFGRGGEELQACLAAGVPVEAVPGISAATGAAAAAQIALTHRESASIVSSWLASAKG
jgi:uroporphyrin-III C-methyltransferase